MLKIEARLQADVSESLDRLVVAAGESALRAAGFAGADVFRAEAKRRVPVDTGVLKENIIVKRAEERSDGDRRQTYLVTVRTGKFNKGGDAFYWRFVEFGTSRSAAKPFIRPAYEAKKREAVEAMKKRLAEKISESLSESK